MLGAMPLLHRADQVSIFAEPQYDGVDAGDLAEALRWHGVRVHLYRT